MLFRPNIPALIQQRNIAKLAALSLGRNSEVRKEALSALLQLDAGESEDALNDVVIKMIDRTYGQRDRALVDVASTLKRSAVGPLRRALEVVRSRMPVFIGSPTEVEQQKAVYQEEQRSLTHSLIRALIVTGEVSVILDLFNQDLVLTLAKLRDRSTTRRPDDGLDDVREGRSMGTIGDALVDLLEASPDYYSDDLINTLVGIQDAITSIPIPFGQFADSEITGLIHRVDLSRLRACAEKEKSRRTVSA